MLNIEAYTDGACLGNPGVGGYAGIMCAKGKIRRAYGMCKEMTTNNRMELTAVISVVDWCNRVQKEPCEIIIYTDSKYLLSCAKKSRKELTCDSRKNNDLWIELIKKGLDGKHHISFVKVQGHAGIELNEQADKLAHEQAVKARHEAYN